MRFRFVRVLHWAPALVLLACAQGKSPPASDMPAEGDAPNASEAGSSAPEATNEPEPRPAPAGGTLVQKIWRVAEVAPASQGVVWVRGCSGVSRVDAGEVRLYSRLDSPLPETIHALFVDARDRAWVIGGDPDGQQLFVEDNGEWQLVLDRPSIETASVGLDGTVWATSNAGVQQVLPQVGEVLASPATGSSGLVAVDNRAFWARTSTYDGVYHWQDGVWSEPFPAQYGFDLKPAQRNVWLAEKANVRLLQWTGSAIEETETIALPRGSRALGFDGSGRLVLQGDQEIQWLTDGQLEHKPAPGGSLSLAADGALYVQAADALYAYREEGPLRLVDLVTESADWFPWEEQFSQALRESSTAASATDFMNPSREVVGKKLSVVGRLYSGFEWAGLRFGDTYVDAVWPDVAPEFWQFVNEHGLNLFGEEHADGLSYPDEDWDLYGYLEAPGCFGHLGASTRLFWVVEAYPRSMAETERELLKAELRARYP